MHAVCTVTASVGPRSSFGNGDTDKQEDRNGDTAGQPAGISTRLVAPQ